MKQMIYITLIFVLALHVQYNDAVDGFKVT